MKPGHKTSELWLVACAIAANIAGELASSLPATWAFGGITATTIAYAISRGLAKLGNAGAAPPSSELTGS